tara:strand:+ start:139 stop:258 length:120 start_codon:yes stop_codon:yes gene_type:complete
VVRVKKLSDVLEERTFGEFDTNETKLKKGLLIFTYGRRY